MPAVFGWRRSFRLAAEFPALIGPLVAERYREREEEEGGGEGGGDEQEEEEEEIVYGCFI